MVQVVSRVIVFMKDRDEGRLEHGATHELSSPRSVRQGAYPLLCAVDGILVHRTAIEQAIYTELLFILQLPSHEHTFDL